MIFLRSLLSTFQPSKLSTFLRQLVGIGSYETYCRHMAEKHPEIKPLSQADFVAEAAKRRHDPGRPGRCPC